MSSIEWYKYYEYWLNFGRVMGKINGLYKKLWFLVLILLKINWFRIHLYHSTQQYDSYQMISRCHISDDSMIKLLPKSVKFRNFLTPMSNFSLTNNAKQHNVEAKVVGFQVNDGQHNACQHHQQQQQDGKARVEHCCGETGTHFCGWKCKSLGQILGQNARLIWGAKMGVDGSPLGRTCLD